MRMEPPRRAVLAVGYLLMVGAAFCLISCKASAVQSAPPVQAERVDRLEQTQAGIVARVEKVETTVGDIKTQVDAQIKAELGNIQAGLINTTKTEANNITNDIVPWLRAGVAVIAIGGLVAVVIVFLIVRKYRYTAEKKKWESSDRWEFEASHGGEEERKARSRAS